jgi:septal ring factor EnvC (AmiA/AmiB activator)
VVLYINCRYYIVMPTDIPDDVARRCEDALESYQEADDFMNQPYPPMAMWPIKQKEAALKVLNEANLNQYNIPEFSKYPQLHNYMTRERERAEKRQKMIQEEQEKAAEAERIRNLPENRLKAKKAELKRVEDDISSIQDSIRRLNVRFMDQTDKKRQLEREISALERQLTADLHFSFNNMALNSSALSDVDVEIKRSLNKLKYLESKLFGIS